MSDQQPPNPAVIGPITAGFQSIVRSITGSAATRTVIAGPCPNRWSITFVYSAGAGFTVSPDLLQAPSTGYQMSSSNRVVTVLWKDLPTLCTGGWSAAISMGNSGYVIEELRIQG